MTITLASFSQSGTSFSNTAKNFVLDGDWRKGLQFLVEGLEGMTYDMAIKILSGTHSIDQDFNLIEDLDVAYQEEVKDIYCDNKFYELNKLYDCETLIDNNSVQQDIYNRNMSSDIPDFDTYVRKYIQGKDQNSFNVTFTKNLNRIILAKEIDSNTMPIWLTKNDFCLSVKQFAIKKFPELNIKNSKLDLVSPSDLNNSSSNSEELDFSDKVRMAMAQDTAINAGFDSVESYSEYHRKKVKDAILERNITYKNKHFMINNLSVCVHYPYELVVAYALSRTKLKGITNWKPVSQPGLKLENDSIIHTDLWLALGFDLDGLEYKKNTYNQKVLDLLVDEVSKEFYPAADFVTLNSAGLDSFEGCVVHADNKNITKNDILVIPHAGPEFDIQARKAGLVISEVGGKLAHLVVVGREFGIPLIRTDDAVNKFKEGVILNINFNDNKISAKLY